MSTNFPTAKQTFTNPVANNKLNNPSHSAQHANANDTIEAIQDKLGIGASSQTPASGKFLVGVGSGQSSWSKDVPTGNVVGTSDTQTLSGKTISELTLGLGSDAAGDVFYGNSSKKLTRLGIGANGTLLEVVSGLPAWVAAARIRQVVVSSSLGQVTFTDRDTEHLWGSAQTFTPTKSGNTVVVALFANGLDNGGSGRLGIYLRHHTSATGTTGTNFAGNPAVQLGQDSTSTNGVMSACALGSITTSSTDPLYIKVVITKFDSSTTWFGGRFGAGTRLLIIEVEN